MKLMRKGGTSNVEVDLRLEGRDDLLDRWGNVVSATGKKTGEVVRVRAIRVGRGRH